MGFERIAEYRPVKDTAFRLGPSGRRKVALFRSKLAVRAWVNSELR